jgi:hypothetical protein
MPPAEPVIESRGRLRCKSGLWQTAQPPDRAGPGSLLLTMPQCRLQWNTTVASDTIVQGTQLTEYSSLLQLVMPCSTYRCGTQPCSAWPQAKRWADRHAVQQYRCS